MLRSVAAILVASGSLALGTALAAEQALPAFRLTSPDLMPGAPVRAAQVFNSFGCTGSNISPALSWSNPPAGTKSFALMVHDPDAPTGSGWWHAVVYNIPANVAGLPARAGDPAAGLMPAGAVQGITDFGTAGYGGPCPPVGDKPHRYHFRLHALKVEKLDLPPTASAAFVGFNVNANTLGVAELMAVYARPATTAK
ncbi:MAG: YbhB/YbcL family Raf kinase inhibitor-like protein [Gammaproteobacteria bacterium]|nr:YbhB/YbcL family Raf kinase inhibitor-like protein [Gammaproteobacteria bacterium]